MRRGSPPAPPVIDRQCLARLQRILLDDVGIFFGRNMRQRGDRQPQARAANRPGVRNRLSAPQLPALALAPALPASAFQRWIGSTKPSRRVKPLIEHPRHPRALLGIGQFGIAGVDIRRQRRFLLQPMAGVFERRHDEFGIDAESFRGAFRKTLGVFDLGLARVLDSGDQVGVLPDRHAVLAPVKPERPARQAFAGIPFALAVMQQAAGRKTRPQAADQLVGEARAWSGRRRRYSIPALPGRRPRRRSARRPWSGARRRLQGRHRPARRACRAAPRIRPRTAG